MTDSLTQAIFDGLQNNSLFDTSTITNTQQIAAFLSSLGTVLQSDPSLASYASQINALSASQLSDLETHLTNQFTNITGNLGLVNSFINSASTYGITTNTDPSNYFGSITGQSDALLTQSLAVANQIMGHVSGTAATSIINAVESAIGNGSITSPDIQSLIKGIGGTQGALSLLGSLSTSGMSQIGSTLQNILSNPLSSLGSAGSLISSITNPAGISNLLQGLSGNILGGNLSSLTSLIGGQGNILQSFSSMLSGFGSGGISSILSGGLGSIMGSNLTGSLGSLASSMGSIGSMISGEISALTGAISGLTNMAGAGALTNLLGGSLGSSVLGSIAGSGLKNALTGTTPSTTVQQQTSATTTDTSNDSNPCSPCTIPSNQSSSNSNPATNSNPTPQSVATPAGTNTTTPARANTAGIGSDANIPLTPTRSTTAGIGSDALADANNTTNTVPSQTVSSNTPQTDTNTPVTGASGFNPAAASGYDSTRYSDYSGENGVSYSGVKTHTTLGNYDIDEASYAGGFAVPNDIKAQTGLRFGFGDGGPAGTNLTNYYGG